VNACLNLPHLTQRSMPGSDLSHLPRSFDQAEDWKTAREHSHSLQPSKLWHVMSVMATKLLTYLQSYDSSPLAAAWRADVLVVLGAIRTQQGGFKSLGAHSQNGKIAHKFAQQDSLSLFKNSCQENGITFFFCFFVFVFCSGPFSSSDFII